MGKSHPEPDRPSCPLAPVTLVGRAEQSVCGVRQPDLVRGCVTSVIAACETLSLPRCTGETLKGIQEKLNCGETPDFGSEVLIAAWMQWQHMDKDSFSAWESSVVRELAQAVMPEIR